MIERITERKESKIDPLAAKMRIEEAGKRYLECEERPRFMVGMWITPAKDSICQGSGEPHLVIATRNSDHIFHDRASPGDTREGRRIDTRVLCLTQDCITAYWVESAEFIPWDTPAK